MMQSVLKAMTCLIPLVLLGCDDDEQTAEQEVIRAIKYMTLEERAGTQERRIAGIVAASQTTNAAFETAGQVTELLRRSGDAVAEGDLIARLDPEPYQLRVAEAENALAQAEAGLDDARKKFAQQDDLFKQGFATRTAFDSAEAAFKNAQGAVGIAESQLDLARRDLKKTDLTAPFSGVIARRDVEVFEEISGGQSIYAIQSADEGKIEASIPETLINIVSLGASVDVSFPPLGGASTTGTIDEIAPSAGDANAYPIEIVLGNAPSGMRPGMSAEVTFSFESAETGTAFVVPMGAVAANPGGASNVFVFDPATQTLSSRSVDVANVHNNSLQIIGDLNPGEIIATAGISFLHDGMRVDLFDPSSLE